MEQAKRDCILIEAARAFAQFGFKKASVDEIAKRARVAKADVVYTLSLGAAALER